MTKSCVNIARREDCYLSFTGFSNGAWLAEHSLYYAHEDFKHAKSKAILFDSPGMCKTEQELKEMNVVNYLTAPCFANSCNRHAGAMYRLFLDQEKFNKLNYIPQIIQRFKEFPLLRRLVKKLENALKNYEFFFIGLANMFFHSHIDLIVELFEEKTGKPKYCERVIKWPIVKLSFDKSFGADLSGFIQNNVKDFTKKKVTGWLMIFNFKFEIGTFFEFNSLMSTFSDYIVCAIRNVSIW